MYIKVKVIPDARREEVRMLKENTFSVSVKEKAEQNMANRRLVSIFEAYFKAPGKVRIIKGHHSQSKMLSIGIE